MQSSQPSTNQAIIVVFIKSFYIFNCHISVDIFFIINNVTNLTINVFWDGKVLKCQLREVKKSRVRIYTEGKMNRRSNCEIKMASLLPFLPKSIQNDYAENKNLEFSFICTGKAKIIGIFRGRSSGRVGSVTEPLSSLQYSKWRSDKLGKPSMVPTSLFGLALSDFYRSQITFTDKNTETNTSHHIVKAYCDAVHGLPFHIGTIERVYLFFI